MKRAFGGISKAKGFYNLQIVDVHVEAYEGRGPCGLRGHKRVIIEYGDYGEMR